MRKLYIFLFYLAVPFFFLRLLWRSRRNPDYRRRWAERLGFSPFTLPQSIWVHSVSVGETIAATPLIKALKAAYPEIPIVVTTMTVTGSTRAQAIFGDSVSHCYIPYDTPFAVSRFLKRINPLVLVVMETELWPTLFAACERRNVPVIIANARLSEKSAANYKRIEPLARQLFQAIHILAAQGQADADRFIALGMPKDRVRITGSLKFDLELPADGIAKSQSLRSQLGAERLIWIAASTHQGEDEIMLAAHRLIHAQHPNALLILVPRHPERFDTVAALATQLGFQVARRSQQTPCTEKTDVYLGDTMGELLSLYGAADVAFVAGSFARVGGHNMLEPAALSKPVVTGPQLYNFAEISHMLLAAQGMRIVQNADELAAEILHLFQDATYCKYMGDNARRVVEANRGALNRQVELVRSLIGASA